MRTSISALFAGAVLGLASLASQAHHSGSIYDESKLTKLQGVLSEVQWVNPHVLFHVDVKGADGKTTQWIVESLAPPTLRNAGLLQRRVLAAQGSVVTVHVAPARDGTPLASLNGIDFADGTNFHLPTRK